MAAEGRHDTPAAPARDPAARRKQLRARNWAMLLALAGFALLLYVVSIVRMSGG